MSVRQADAAAMPRGDAIVIQGDARSLPLPDESVDLIVTSPPYFALRSYRDGDEHYEGQIGSEDTPQDFLEALWVCTEEMKRVLKPSGSIFVNLGDKYAGSGGHNNSGLQGKTGQMATRAIVKAREDARARAREVGGGGADRRAAARESSRRNAPDAYNKATIGGARAKSLMLLPERYRIGCVDRLGLWARQVLIWSKPNGLPESVKDRARRSHEDWVHLTKAKDYFAAVDEIREEHAPVSIRKSQSADVLQHEDTHVMDMSKACHPLGKLPGSVWTIPSEPLSVPAHLGIDHFAAFPQEWPRRLILGWSPSGICTECGEGRYPIAERHYEKTWNDARTRPEANPDNNLGAGFDGRGLTSREITGYACACPEPTAPTQPAVVLDPFGGTGTVAMVARALGRYGISVDLSHDYCRLARWRVFESGHASKAIARTAKEAQEVLAI